jgi:hypothetical protein
LVIIFSALVFKPQRINFFFSSATTNTTTTNQPQQGAKKVEQLLDEALARLDRERTVGQTIDELIDELAAVLPQSEEVQLKLRLLVEDREKGRRARALKKQLAARAETLERLEAQVA